MRFLFTWQFGFFFLAGLLYFTGGHVSSYFEYPLEPSALQFIAFPLVLIAFSGIPFGAKKLPRVFVILAVAGVCAGALNTHQYRTTESTLPFLTTRFEGDSFGSKTKKFRAYLAKRLNIEGALPTTHHHAQVKSQSDAAELLIQSAELQGVLWKAGDRLMLSTREGLGEEEDKYYKEHLTFRKRVKRGVESAQKFEVIRNIPIVSLALKPERESARFLGALLSAQVSTSPIEKESLLRAAVDQASFWSGFEHRGYAALLLGNTHLDAAFKPKPIEAAELACAIEAYETGLGFVPYGKHPELRAALLNNKAVALAVRAFAHAENSELKTAKEHFHAALQTAKHRNRYLLDYRAAYIAGKNLSRLKKMRN